MYTSLYDSMKMPNNADFALMLNAEKKRREDAKAQPALSTEIDHMLRSVLITGVKGRYAVLDAFANQLADTEEDWEKFITMLAHYNELLPFLQHLLELEVEKSAHEETLFRANSISVRLVSACMRLGGQSLRESITKPFAKLSGRTLRRALGLEFGEQPVAAASELLGLSLSFLLELLEKSVLTCPFIPLLAIVRECVASKYGNDVGLSAVGGFVFLRFLTPCLTTLDLSEADNPAVVRRNVLFVSKVFQKLSNDTKFDDSHPLKIQNIWIQNAKQQRTGLLMNFSTSKTAVNLFPQGIAPFTDVAWFMSLRSKLAFDLTANLRHLPAFVEGCLEIQSHLVSPVTEPYVLPVMSNTKQSGAVATAADQFRNDKLDEMLAKIEDRALLVKMIKDQSLLLARQHTSLTWHKESLEQAKAVCGNIRDKYVAQLSAPDRFALERVLANREDSASTGAPSRKTTSRMLRSISCQELSAGARSERWSVAVFRRQVLNVALSLPNVSGMPGTISLLLRCPHCDKPTTTKKALEAHMEANCESDKQSGEVFECKHCGRPMYDAEAFSLHESLCGVNSVTSPREEAAAGGKKKGGSSSRWRRKGSRAATIGRSFTKRSSVPNFVSIADDEEFSAQKAKAPKGGSSRLRKTGGLHKKEGK